MNVSVNLECLGGQGPDVVLIHGYGSDRQSWLATAPALFCALKVWVMDLPAHGQASPDCGDGSIETLSNGVLTAIDQCGIDEFHVIGHSLGGRISMQLAADQPVRVRSLVAMAPAGLGDRLNTEFLGSFASATDEQAVHALLLSLVHDPKMIGRGLASAVLSYLQRPGTRDSLALISKGLQEAQQAVPAIIDSLQNNNVRRLLLWGENDAINPISLDKANLFGGELQLLDHCGHLPHVEKRSPVNRLLLDFYTGLPG